MITPFIRYMAAAAIAWIAVSAYAAQNDTQPAPMRLSAELVTITAKVEAVDVAHREITLKGPLGNMVTVTADERIKRLEDIRAGDDVTVAYYLGIAAELRQPTPAELAEPLLIVDSKTKALPNRAPAASAGRTLRVVGTVEALDRITKTATFKGPQGRYLTVRVEEPGRLEKLRLGDTVVVSCAAAVAVAVEKK